MYKFRNATTNSSTDITPTQATIISDLSFSASIPSTLFLILNACFGHKFPLKLRMNGSMLVILVVFILNTGLIKVNTDAWQDTFFDITIVSVVIMNISAAIMSGGLFGISGLFSSEYMTAVVSGQALGGILTAIAEIITLTFSTDALKSTWIFFLIGNVLLALSLVAYIAVSRTKFFKYHIEVKSTVSSYHLAEDEPNFRNVLSKMWLYGFTEWLVFAVTISVYPAVTVLVSSENHGNGSPWNDIYFIPVTNYLIFNTGDYLGRILAGMIEWVSSIGMRINKGEFLIKWNSYVIWIAAKQPTVHSRNIVNHANCIFASAYSVQHKSTTSSSSFHSFRLHFHSVDVCIRIYERLSRKHCNDLGTEVSLVKRANDWNIFGIFNIRIPSFRSVGIREKEMASSTMAAFLGLGLAFGSTLSLILVQLV